MSAATLSINPVRLMSRQDRLLLAELILRLMSQQRPIRIIEREP